MTYGLQTLQGIISEFVPVPLKSQDVDGIWQYAVFPGDKILEIDLSVRSRLCLCSAPG